MAVKEDLSGIVGGYAPLDSGLLVPNAYLDADLAAIAALTTTSYGRSLLTLANKAALIAEVSSAPLAIASYAAGSDGLTYTCTTTHADVDATNLTVTFTAPDSGKVIVVLCGLYNSGTASNQYWMIRESAADIAGTVQFAATGSALLRATTVHYITGISGGSHTYLWGFFETSGTNYISTGPTFGKATMAVFAA